MSYGSQNGKSRQARRAEERRKQKVEAHRPPPGRYGKARRSLLLFAAVAALLIGAIMTVRQVTTSPTSSSTQDLANMVGPSVDGMKCGNESVTYHVHSHLAVYIKGRPWHLDRYAGQLTQDSCEYWLHRHADENGIIHIEGPNAINPNLKTWFDIVAKTEGKRAVPNLMAGQGQERRIWVDMKPYFGDPLRIPLRQHTDITVEVGPPFHQPKKFNFATYNL